MPRKAIFIPLLSILVSGIFILFAQKVTFPIFAFSGEGLGTSTNPYEITTCAQLQEMSDDLDTFYILENNISCTETSTWNSGMGFLPIGNDSTPFTGELDGNGKTISELVINNTETGTLYFGMFGAIDSANIYDLNLTNFSIDVTHGKYVGALVGAIDVSSGSSVISNISISDSEIAGDSFVGGMAGTLLSDDAEISYCSIEANVSGTNAGDTVVGGLIGEIDGIVSLHDCDTSGSVTASGSSSGGMVGYISEASVVFRNNSSDSSVSGITYIGGLIGHTACDIEDSYADGNITGHDAVGGVVGHTDADIINSYSGSVVQSVGDNVGGLVGDIEGSITNSYSIGNVSGGTNVGGLVGHYNVQSGGSETIQKSYALGDVTGDDDVGGLVGVMTTLGTAGENTNIILNCYAMGDVTENDWNSDGIEIGGLVGGMNTGSIENSFSQGIVSSGNFEETTGGLVGYAANSVTSVIGSFWDTENSGLSSSDGGIGMSTSDMKDRYTYLGEDWDFETVWNINGTKNAGYPFFGFGGSGYGTYTHPYIVNNCALLQDMKYDLVGYYSVTQNIDCDGYEWTPVGSSPENAFAGLLDGNNKTVSNLSIINNESEGNFLGLFGVIVGGTISDITISDAYIYAPGIQGVGILAGATWTGGSASIITDVAVSGEVYGESIVGGLIGYTYNSLDSITDCSADADIYQDGQGMVGGLIGMNYAHIEGCSALGDIYSSGDSDTASGGLVGMSVNTEGSAGIFNCYATGDVSGQTLVGGLVGMATAPIEESYALGDVYGVDTVGGLVGYGAGTITRSYAIGDVSGASAVGGLVGNLLASLTESYSIGYVSGDSNLGGLVGMISDGNVSGSYYDYETSGQSESEKGTPVSTAQMALESTFEGWDFDDVWILGLPANLSVTPSSAGTIYATGQFLGIPTLRFHIKLATVTENSAMGYEFSSWEEDGEVVSTNSSYTFSYTGGESAEKEIIAIFVLQPQEEEDNPSSPTVEEAESTNTGTNTEDLTPRTDTDENLSTDTESNQSSNDSDAVVDTTDESVISIISKLVNNVVTRAKRISEQVIAGIASIPVDEDTSQSISATAVAVVIITPMVTVGLGSSASFVSFFRFSTFGFAFLGLRKKRRNCGLVYNSVTKEPLGNAIIRIYTKEGILSATEVTNNLGIFESNIQTGDYKIVVSINGFKFPTAKIMGDMDTPYAHIYKGEDFHYDDSLPMDFSIPVDPLDRVILDDTKAMLRGVVIKVFESISNLAVLVGLGFTVIAYIKLNNLTNLFLLLAYTLILVLSLILSRVGKFKFGIVKNNEKNVLEGVKIGLIETEFNTLAAKRVTDKEGRYRFIVPGGNYKLVSLDPSYQFQNEKELVFNNGNKKIISISKDLFV